IYVYLHRIMSQQHGDLVQPLKYPKKIQIAGADSTGNTFYTNIDDLWNKELGSNEQQQSQWYTNAADYWKNVEPTLDGMLGGLGHIAETDVESSNKFITEMASIGRKRALDCGAGIGRVTKNLLLPLFETVDLLEQNPAFLDEAKVAFKDEKRVDNYFAMGLQDFKFQREDGTPLQYDCVWIQWVIGHLTDKDLILFIRRCLAALAPNGVLCIKDNTAKRSFVMDKDDSSVTRSDNHFRYLFEQSGAKLLKTELQPNFPTELFPVRFYALQSSLSPSPS
ncbi:hypothetical protein SAMD00019534_008990, partial [Acytostelium subglobosum LB1]|uniref:hypothetical protein n=1 Tax=Acytostelium subglobosum LB1 TaxID=1410327 RepID=UPI000644830C